MEGQHHGGPAPASSSEDSDGGVGVRNACSNLARRVHASVEADVVAPSSASSCASEVEVDLVSAAARVREQVVARRMSEVASSNFLAIEDSSDDIV